MAQKINFKDATTQLPIGEVSVLNKNNKNFLITS
jgi:hypothetical protein